MLSFVAIPIINSCFHSIPDFISTSLKSFIVHALATWWCNRLTHGTWVGGCWWRVWIIWCYCMIVSSVSMNVAPAYLQTLIIYYSLSMGNVIRHSFSIYCISNIHSALVTCTTDVSITIYYWFIEWIEQTCVLVGGGKSIFLSQRPYIRVWVGGGNFLHFPSNSWFFFFLPSK